MTSGNHIPAIGDLVRYADEWEWMRVDDVKRFHEYKPHELRDPEQMPALMESIKSGWREPVILTYFKGDDTALLGEGNHRLWAASKLGLWFMPVRVVRYSGEGRKRRARSVPGWTEGGHVPGEMVPSDIGLEGYSNDALRREFEIG